ncbi:MAG: YvcK family protein, partial [Acidobacteria bacterium]|nr:YvcK family protein [Acidobacteriota bacterium]
TSGEVLAIRGRILPATLENVVLRARLDDGRLVCGESRISASRSPIVRISTSPRSPGPAPGVLSALREADLIILGPGSLFISVLPNLLVRGVARTIARARALKVLVGNLMTQPGETGGFAAEDHLAAIDRVAGPGLVDVYLASAGPIRPALRRRYARERAHPVPWSPAAVRRRGVVPVARELLQEDPHVPKVRHHGGKLARSLLSILRRSAS